MDGLIIILLLINAGYHINKQLNARRYRMNEVDRTLLRLSGAGYLVVNIICMCLVFLF